VATRFEAEVREQPAVLRRLLEEGRAPALAIADAIRGRTPRFAVLAARGSSDNAARYGQYLLGIRNGLVAALATPSVFTHYAAAPALADALVIGISQSGESPDVVAVLREARGQGALTLALTNVPASPLGTAAEHVLPLLAGEERAVAATKTYTAELGALALLSAALCGDGLGELEALPGRLDACLERSAGAVEHGRRFAAHGRMVVVGRGYNLSTAFEIALKIQETSGVMADGYSSADFLHGPRAIAGSGLPIVMVAAGRAFEDLDGIADLAREKGAPLVAISERSGVLAAASVALPLPEGVPEWLTPLVAVVPGQLFSLGLSLGRGGDPDAPAGLSKITRTR